jgi:L-histidine Nalpha-methyltransferase
MADNTVTDDTVNDETIVDDTNDAVTVDVHLTSADRDRALTDDARIGLTSSPKTTPPLWFYDDRGSQLFDEITRLPEYYLTRAERSILADHAYDIVTLAGCDTLVELGSGTSEKTLLLLDAMVKEGRLHRFVPFDVSEATLRSAAIDISSTYAIPVTAVVGDFHRHLGLIPRDGRRLFAFLGSTIGNLTPPQRHTFFVELSRVMTSDDRLLLGTDLVKDVRRLLAAYDDAAGVTAAFNHNLLSVFNHELGASFDPDTFDHVVRWDAAQKRIEMRLRSRIRQTIRVQDLGLDVAFEAGEDLLTEISSKFTKAQVQSELGDSGFSMVETWSDQDGDYLLTLARLSQTGPGA